MKYLNIAAVWLKKDKNDKTFLSFKAERDIKKGDSIALFRNDKGDNPARPDFRAYEKVEEAEATTETTTEAPAVEQDDDDDIPF